MISVVLVGTGNVSKLLFNAFLTTKEVNVKQVIGRSEKKLNYFKKSAHTSTNFKKLFKAEIYIIAVKDDAIIEVSEKMSSVDGLVVHTSGAIPMEALKVNAHTGVLYPLQTFTSGKKVDFKEIPICIETSEKDDLALLKRLANSLSDKVEVIDSEKRKILHIAAVFSNNFTNYLFTAAKEICDDNELDFNLLKPLILETASKISDMTPRQAQTGPAVRNDQKTMREHLSLLENEKHREIYILLSNAIKDTYG
ncbi:Rossmann-like and DUF2520 domain-containing protein [Maribacter sp. 2210JD10-5]|uniref:Rossmann-like and DUF2520 domain-containing protein n=1 Tax=Maribacter sp. 2210JD10-5 TaxID=3386272 RepID=UPI0039BCC255